MLEADLKETTTTKDRLLLAEKSAGAPTPVRGIPGPGPHTTTLMGGGKGAEEAAAKDQRTPVRAGQQPGGWLALGR